MLRFRPAAHLRTMALAVLLGLTLPLSHIGVAHAAGSTYYVSPSGSDTNPGTLTAPWRTVAKGMTSLSPGDTLYLRGGTYIENITGKTIRPATATSPIRVVNYPGERPVVQGLLWLTGPSYWTLDGVNVTWNPSNPSTSHMVKMVNGKGWTLKNSELWGAHSFANLLVAGTTVGEPANWNVSNNCIHDTYASNNPNQDQLIYANTGLTAGSGVIERNLLFNATNGMGVKLGGPSATSGGSVNVSVRNNTIYNTSQSTLVSWQSNNNTISGNLMDLVGTNYSHVRGYQLTGVNNVVTNNAAGAAKGFILNDPGYLGVQNGGGNLFPVAPAFDSVSGCGGFHPTNPDAAGYGRYAGTSADVTPPSSPTGLAATATSSTQVNLSWQPSTDNVGVTGYTVYRNGTPKTTLSGTSTLYSDTSVTASTTYTYTVDAVDAAGNRSALSSQASVTTPAAPALAPAPAPAPAPADSYFSDGFESANLAQWTGSSGSRVQQEHVFAGSWAARATSTGSPAYLYKSLSSPISDLYYNGRVKVISQGATGSVSLVRFRTSTGAPILSILRRSDGRLLYYNEVTRTSTLGPLMSSGVWHNVQVHVLVNGSASQIGVWMDGVQITTMTKTDSLGTAGVGRLYVGDPGSGKTYDFAFDAEALSSNYIP